MGFSQVSTKITRLGVGAGEEYQYQYGAMKFNSNGMYQSPDPMAILLACVLGGACDKLRLKNIILFYFHTETEKMKTARKVALGK